MKRPRVKMMTMKTIISMLLLAACLWPAAAQETPLSAAEPSPETEASPGFEATDPVDVLIRQNPVTGTGGEPPAPPSPPESGGELSIEGIKAELGLLRGEPGPVYEREPAGSSRNRPFSMDLMQALAALLAVLALILLLSYLLRRLGKGVPALRGMHLGQTIGRIYLTPRASIHFVRTGGRVLLVGVSPNQVSLVAEFDEDAFETEPAPAGEKDEPAPALTHFVTHLKQRWAAADGQQAAPMPLGDEIASLRGDIQRLQEYLKESSQGETGR
jgi:flagellar biogenesis protein FliO